MIAKNCNRLNILLVRIYTKTIILNHLLPKMDSEPNVITSKWYILPYSLSFSLSLSAHGINYIRI